MYYQARPDGSVQLLVLTKEASADVFSTYPEEFEIITSNLLQKFDLTDKGTATLSTTVLPGTDVEYCGVTCYAESGTEVAYGATRRGCCSDDGRR
eukprot:2005489-Rhodomonas_salina.3